MATRNSITLPVENSKEIIKKTQESSAVMKLARKIELPGLGMAIPVITGDVEAEWVGEGENRKVANPTLDTKIMRGHKLSVIVPFSNEFKRDMGALYDELVKRLPNALANKFDATVFGAYEAPSADFDTFKDVTLFSLAPNAYDALVASDTDVATHGGIISGYVFSPQGKGVLLGSKDNDGRPLFINNVSEGAIPVILGAKTELSKGAYVPKTEANVVGFGGDWSQALYGTVENVNITFSDQATLDLGNGQTINLFQRDMFAVKAEIEVGFRADLTVFNGYTVAKA